LDISQLVNSEDLFELRLQHPVTEEPLGIIFMIRSAESNEVKKTIRQHGDRLLASRKKRLTASRVEAEYIDKAAAAIASWDWGSQQWKGGRPELTFDTAREVVEEAGWIYDQIAVASEDRANFMRSSPAVSWKPLG
jgi:hypothetical protein